MERIAAQTMGYIQEHWAEPVSIQGLARRFWCSVGHLILRFKSATGQTPYHALMTLRMRKAQSLLRETTLSISDIAQVTGFCDASFFAVTFRQKIGLTPRAYRRTHETVAAPDLLAVVQTLWHQVNADVQRGVVMQLLEAARGRTREQDPPIMGNARYSHREARQSICHLEDQALGD